MVARRWVWARVARAAAQAILQWLSGLRLLRPSEKVQRVPVVLTVEEVKRLMTGMSGPAQLVAKLLYGSGLRLLEGLRLRVKDIDFGMKQITVRDGKGARDRYTVLADNVTTMIYTHVLQQGGSGMKSPLDCL